ncbi:chemotaxis protein CheX [Mobilitalea sibirica]|uniref:Chemotaxis protein CheX n=1 Tax=Mobilitalea sibirica TaxID=1462919 RepID=A0A8J7HCS0_9FIRM|nr:chemotaxis protein CheX [Mobilitalea sibirica]MBH1940159.1 chemotaxis protein CheX [Mobilitalea sibirica]
MFGQYFGSYLVDKNKISQSQFDEVIKEQQNSRVKLGLIAVAEKLLTTKQAQEVNELQKQMDRRFGDIAIDKGYLLTEEVNYLLNMQGNPYLKFVQALTENHIMTIDEIEIYLEAYKSDHNFSDSEIDALKSGDIDRIIPVFVDTDIPFGGECISIAIRNIVRFIHNNIMLKKAYMVKEYSFGNLGYQQVVGDHDIFLGFASKGDELLTIANPFAKEEFTEMNEDSFDSVCEFINCINGLFASKLSNDDIHIDMTPPLFYKDKTLASKGDIYVVPVVIEGKQSDLLVVVDNKVEIN